MSRMTATFCSISRRFRRKAVLGALSLGAVVVGCDSGGPQGAARIQVLVTDAPADYIESAELYVSRVYLQGGGDEEGEGGRVDLFNDPDNPQVFDLLALQDGLMFAVTDEVVVPEGPYAQLRFVVDMAMVTLADGYFFQDETNTAELHVPSGSSSGVKVTLDGGPLVLEEDQTTTVVVDVDVNANFVIQGNPESQAGIQGVTFTPHLKEIAREES